MSDYHDKRAKEILGTIIYATVATASKNGKPWNSPVAYFTDSDMNIYWFSDNGSVHSRNIKENSNIFIVVYDSTMKEGTGEGLYIEATAVEINDEIEIEKVAGYQTGKMRAKPEQCKGDSTLRFYKALPSNMWVNDVETDENGKYLKDIKVKVKLNS